MPSKQISDLMLLGGHMSNPSDSDTMLHHLIPDPIMRERLLNRTNLEFLAPLYDFEPHIVAHMFSNGMSTADLLRELLKKEPDPRRLAVQLDLKESEATPQDTRTAADAETQYLARLQALVPDAAQRERLLDVENLAFLAALYDFEQRDLESIRASGMTPVDVVLELLKREPDPRRLIVLLNLREEEEKKQARAAADKPKNTTSSAGADGRQKAKHATPPRKPVSTFDEAVDESLMILKNKIVQFLKRLRKFFHM
jgi:hypothetical protein